MIFFLGKRRDTVTISCGIIIHDKDRFLVGHVTHSNSRHYGIPKGRAEEGESFIECAVRETKEETGIDLSSVWQDLIVLGEFDYIPSKKLFLFEHVCKLPTINSLRCDSFFEDSRGRKFPEFDGFKYITLQESRENLHPKIVDILIKEFPNGFTRRKSDAD